MNVSEVDEGEVKEVYGFWLEGVLLPFISLPGILGNIACVFVLNNKSVDLKQSFSNILKCLSIFDVIFLVGVTCLYTLPQLSTQYKTYFGPLATPAVLPITQIALTGSVYSVVAVAVERYFNICKPFNRNRAGAFDGFGYITGILLFAVIYNIVKFFELRIEFETRVDNSTNTSANVPEVAFTDLRKNPIYANVYIVFNTLVMGVLPLSLVWFLNWRIIVAMKQATRRHNNISSLQRRDRAMTALLSGVVIVLLIGHTPKTIINIYESYQMIVYGKMKYKPIWGDLMIKMSHLLLTLSSALNIIIYSYKDFKFRAVVASACSCTTNTRITNKFPNGVESQIMTAVTHVDRTEAQTLHTNHQITPDIQVQPEQRLLRPQYHTTSL